MRPILILMLTFLLAAPAVAQTIQEVKPADAKPAEPVAPVIEPLPPAYEKPMQRLAEILGALHYLRELCGAKEGQRWREEMEALLLAEEPTEARKAMLVARFNRGFRGYSETYRKCTPQAAEAANRHLQQGARLSAEIPGRYGN
jgi:uncharacterized protein (TIGR02301 family)